MKKVRLIERELSGPPGEVFEWRLLFPSNGSCPKTLGKSPESFRYYQEPVIMDFARSKDSLADREHN